jgi:plastocyanin
MKKVVMLILVGALALMIAQASPKKAQPATEAATATAADGAVTIKNFEFVPKSLTVKAGTTVVWTDSEGRHTVEADKNEFKSDVLTSGKTFSFKFDKPGKYAYHCGFHGDKGGKDMAGTIVVTK